MTEYRYEYGKRWDARVPRNDINWVMGRTHVSTPNEDVEADIRKRCSGPGFTPSIIRQSIAYAVECHRRNRLIYDRVTCGNY